MQSQLTQKQVCLFCGAVNAGSVRECWICHHPLEAVAGLEQSERMPPVEAVEASARERATATLPASVSEAPVPPPLPPSLPPLPSGRAPVMAGAAKELKSSGMSLPAAATLVLVGSIVVMPGLFIPLAIAMVLGARAVKVRDRERVAAGLAVERSGEVGRFLGITCGTLGLMIAASLGAGMLSCTFMVSNDQQFGASWVVILVTAFIAGALSLNFLARPSRAARRRVALGIAPKLAATKRTIMPISFAILVISVITIVSAVTTQHTFGGVILCCVLVPPMAYVLRRMRENEAMTGELREHLATTLISGYSIGLVLTLAVLGVASGICLLLVCGVS